MRDRVYRANAIVLKRTDFGEADRLLTLFTRDLGKIRAIAKGARKPTSRKSGHVELFTHTTLLVAKGRHLDIVTQAETLEAFMPLRENLDRLGFAYYLAELVDQFLEENVENPPLFDELLDALRSLGDAKTDPALLARYFELHLLKNVGYQPQLFNCANCSRAIAAEGCYFSAEMGGLLDPECAEKTAERGRDHQPISPNALKILQYLQTREWATANGMREDADVLIEVEILMRRYITHHLERNLKSVEFLNTLRHPAHDILSGLIGDA